MGMSPGLSPAENEPALCGCAARLVSPGGCASVPPGYRSLPPNSKSLYLKDNTQPENFPPSLIPCEWEERPTRRSLGRKPCAQRTGFFKDAKTAGSRSLRRTHLSGSQLRGDSKATDAQDSSARGELHGLRLPERLPSLQSTTRSRRSPIEPHR